MGSGESAREFSFHSERSACYHGMCSVEGLPGRHEERVPSCWSAASVAVWVVFLVRRPEKPLNALLPNCWLSRGEKTATGLLPRHFGYVRTGLTSPPRLHATETGVDCPCLADQQAGRRAG